ncbi:hypothetical protein VCRA2119O147_560024 [Vibrio crassostreae]|nr:hypothetical protein VCRA2118O236_390001 [Vibrio crassostreae]CAK2372476.1 hypothetical protein VCRA2119O147_560024 [Vibrio crassostreae]CAK2910220.1 hypothetical protein VCRA2110O183_420019 [Vibrio crassostreae]CAK2984838.1 hypothetical protein VCRA2121O264_420020 [Vibrio crassostreae]CAK3521803.1 hypothetical protein VCRA2128O309_700001 [Vibrio crassostreae]
MAFTGPLPLYKYTGIRPKKRFIGKELRKEPKGAERIPLDAMSGKVSRHTCGGD